MDGIGQVTILTINNPILLLPNFSSFINLILHLISLIKMTTFLLLPIFLTLLPGYPTILTSLSNSSEYPIKLNKMILLISEFHLWEGHFVAIIYLKLKLHPSNKKVQKGVNPHPKIKRKITQIKRK